MYDLAGVINSLFVFVSLYGIFLQLRTLWLRRSQGLASSTKLLSSNQFTVSYFAYLSFFIYGYSVAPFNHYMVWPRLIACCLILLIIREIYRDRRTLLTRNLFLLTSATLIFALVGLIIGDTWVDEGRKISSTLILLVTAFLAQGYWHQILLIYRSGQTGAVNIRMNQFILAMDFSTVFLAYTMGLESSWPMVVLATVSGITKVIIMGLFRWVRTSRFAAAKRLAVKAI